MTTLNSAQFLDKTIKDFDNIDARTQKLLSGLSETQFNHRPEPGKWSIAQCLEHLILVNDMYIDAIGKALGSAPTPVQNSADKFGTNRAEEVNHSLFARMFIASLASPPKFKMPAPGRVQPQNDQSELDTVKDRYLNTHEKMREFANICVRDGVDIQRLKVQSPISSLVKLSLAAVFDVCVAHENRHLWQAENVKLKLA